MSAFAKTLSYDPLGRLFHSGSGGSATQFIYDPGTGEGGEELVAEYQGGAVTQRYVHGAGVDEPIAWFVGASTAAANRRSLYADHQGSIVGIGDNAGSQLAINRYDSWGVPAATNSGRFQYTGQIWLPELAMYHYKARLYAQVCQKIMLQKSKIRAYLLTPAVPKTSAGDDAV